VSLKVADSKIPRHSDIVVGLILRSVKTYRPKTKGKVYVLVSVCQCFKTVIHVLKAPNK